MDNKINEFQDRENHTIINEDVQKGRNAGLEAQQAIHLTVAYKGKNITVHLRFTEEQSDKNAQLFYDSLKKIYMEKDEFRAMIPELSALKYNK